MKVIAFNGSPNKEGNTYQAIRILGQELEKEGIEMEIIHVGNKVIRGCVACGQCAKNNNERCIQSDDDVNEWIQKMKKSDGVILGSPVHYSSIGATMKAFLDRAFYVTSVNNGMLRHKVGVAVVVARRAGGVPTFHQLNNYISYSEMLIPTSNYWNIFFGTKSEDILQDEEGIQTLRVLGKNMVWAMQLIEHGKSSVKEPGREKKSFTNFIR
ncbi:MAG: flavodoxin family protein [Firmicutes bacterium HGW-Firmicutes-1]|jgi:multimeric flavodoxin WrbA|nr:MAG: flavodoxin family protein [Firmicutes bacterium HGW-Firmicutes-1]